MNTLPLPESCGVNVHRGISGLFLPEGYAGKEGREETRVEELDNCRGKLALPTSTAPTP